MLNSQNKNNDWFDEKKNMKIGRKKNKTIKMYAPSFCTFNTAKLKINCLLINYDRQRWIG